MNALPQPIRRHEPLDRDAIRDALQAALGADRSSARAAARAIPSIEVVASIDSTNSALLERLPRLALPHALLAEQQLAGRGRRGRRWNSDGSASLCLSLAWRSPHAPAACAPVALVAGLACSLALRERGVPVQLKWPNDLVLGAGKLGGILVEARPMVGATGLVVGLGLNLGLPPAADAAPGAAGAALPPSALSSLPAGLVPGRNALAGELLAALCRALLDFDARGFAPFRDAYAAVDWLAGRAVAIDEGGACRHGIARGIAADGALLVESGGVLHAIRAGDVSVRPA